MEKFLWAGQRRSTGQFDTFSQRGISVNSEHPVVNMEGVIENKNLLNMK